MNNKINLGKDDCEKCNGSGVVCVAVGGDDYEEVLCSCVEEQTAEASDTYSQLS